MLRLGDRRGESRATSSVCFAAWKRYRKTAGNAAFFSWDLSGTSHLIRTVEFYLNEDDLMEDKSPSTVLLCAPEQLLGTA